MILWYRLTMLAMIARVVSSNESCMHRRRRKLWSCVVLRSAHEKWSMGDHKDDKSCKKQITLGTFLSWRKSKSLLRWCRKSRVRSTSLCNSQSFPKQAFKINLRDKLERNKSRIVIRSWASYVLTFWTRNQAQHKWQSSFMINGLLHEIEIGRRWKLCKWNL
jgi:hypothetical protein